MGNHFPSGESRITRRDRRVKRIHVTLGGERTLCNKARSDGDISIQLYGLIGNRAPSNLCKICQHIYLR